MHGAMAREPVGLAAPYRCGTRVSSGMSSPTAHSSVQAARARCGYGLAVRSRCYSPAERSRQAWRRTSAVQSAIRACKKVQRPQRQYSSWFNVSVTAGGLGANRHHRSAAISAGRWPGASRGDGAPCQEAARGHTSAIAFSAPSVHVRRPRNLARSWSSFHGSAERPGAARLHIQRGISACGKARRPHKAMELLAEMQQKVIAPYAIACSSAISIC